MACCFVTNGCTGHGLASKKSVPSKKKKKKAQKIISLISVENTSSVVNI